MQPYLFPYLGYFQLINAVDAFVAYDDVNYIKGGWINRNFICAKDHKQLITLPTQGASPNKLINQVLVGNGSRKLLQTIRQTYSKAPEFLTVFPLIEDIFHQEEENLARFVDYQLRQICEYLGINTTWYISSELKYDKALSGQERVLAICDEMGATHYINAEGGQTLYDKGVFSSRDKQLSFLRTKTTPYPQFSNTFTSHLSIIDVMMFNDKAQCMKLLQGYELV
ncbi:WbqC family protein [Candidatus Marimicrobium litorale]|nr:WbqC family protein [Candidatus Marimicrobium litorale]